MRTEFKFLIIAVLAFQLAIIVVLFHYNSQTYLSRFTWKLHHGNCSKDFLYFRGNQNGSGELRWPQIYNKDGDNIGLYILCVDEELLIYSYGDNTFGLYQAK